MTAKHEMHGVCAAKIRTRPLISGPLGSSAAGCDWFSCVRSWRRRRRSAARMTSNTPTMATLSAWPARSWLMNSGQSGPLRLAAPSNTTTCPGIRTCSSKPPASTTTSQATQATTSRWCGGRPAIPSAECDAIARRAAASHESSSHAAAVSTNPACSSHFCVWLAPKWPKSNADANCSRARNARGGSSDFETLTPGAAETPLTTSPATAITDRKKRAAGSKTTSSKAAMSSRCGEPGAALLTTPQRCNASTMPTQSLPLATFVRGLVASARKSRHNASRSRVSLSLEVAKAQAAFALSCDDKPPRT
mmetsp:Transcript_41579/g.114554  ORF Transcript_41579/g.114554 Transcript_41579/m.114554 type:complete len:306 (+) Transcript_41579:185-1102(+)